MGDLLDKAIGETLAKDVYGATFLVGWSRDEQNVKDLIKEVEMSIAKHGLSASEAKGFLDYMKFVIDSSAHISDRK